MGKLNQDEEIFTMPEELPVTKNTAFKYETRMTKSTAISPPRGTSRDSRARTVALANEDSGNMQKLDDQIKALMTKGSKKNMHGQPIYVCNVCGKESKQGNMKNHIEANHLEGISVPCNLCEKFFRSRNAKATHVSLLHRGQQDLA